MEINEIKALRSLQLILWRCKCHARSARRWTEVYDQAQIHKVWGNKPDISNSAQCDFFPLAASSADMMVYNRRGSGGSYFSFGIPVNLRGEKRDTNWVSWCTVTNSVIPTCQCGNQHQCSHFLDAQQVGCKCCVHKDTINRATDMKQFQEGIA